MWPTFRSVLFLFILMTVLELSDEHSSNAVVRSKGQVGQKHRLSNSMARRKLKLRSMLKPKTKKKSRRKRGNKIEQNSMTMLAVPKWHYANVSDHSTDSHDDNYHVRYETEFAFQNVDKFGVKVKYNKSEHIFYGRDVAEQKRSKLRTSRIKENKLAQDTETYNSYVLPYVDNNGIWLIQRSSKDEMFPQHWKYQYNAPVIVEFYLYTRKNLERRVLVKSRDPRNLLDSGFVNTIPTVFIIHGWQNADEKEESISNIRKAYLQVGDYNIFMVEWTQLTSTLNYYLVSARVKQVGEKVAEFINFLTDRGGARITDMRIIGHSFGAHVAGIAGKNLRGQLPSIVGLEPARLMYSIEATGEKLKKSDAKFVEIGHSSLVGVYDPIGHVDYYFNEGHDQPTCWTWNFGCDHAIINHYFAETIIDTTKFVLEQCRNLDDLSNNRCIVDRKNPVYFNGRFSNKRLRGIYNVKTQQRRI